MIDDRCRTNAVTAPQVQMSPSLFAQLTSWPLEQQLPKILWILRRTAWQQQPLPRPLSILQTPLSPPCQDSGCTLASCDLPCTPITNVDQLLDTVYGDLVHANPGFHLSGDVADDHEWQTYLRWLIVYPSQQSTNKKKTQMSCHPQHWCLLEWIPSALLWTLVMALFQPATWPQLWQT